MIIVLQHLTPPFIVRVSCVLERGRAALARQNIRDESVLPPPPLSAAPCDESAPFILEGGTRSCEYAVGGMHAALVARCFCLVRQSCDDLKGIPCFAAGCDKARGEGGCCVREWLRWRSGLATVAFGGRNVTNVYFPDRC